MDVLGTPAARDPLAGAGRLWRELAGARRHNDVRRHPLAVRWRTGDVPCDVLASYAEEYDHILVALAAVARRCAFRTRGELAAVLHEDAADRDALVDRWRARAQQLGWGPGTAWHYGCDPLPQTRACCALCLGSERRPVGLDLVTLCVLDQAQPGLPLGSGLGRAHAGAVRIALCQVGNRFDTSVLAGHARRIHVALAELLDAVDTTVTDGIDARREP